MAEGQRPGRAFLLLTFTSRDLRSDEDMRWHWAKLLMWGRKYLGPWFEYYVWAAQLQQRGVLHFHLVLSRRLPYKLRMRLRAVWAELYGMGPGSVDWTNLRSAKGAAKYLGKYLTKRAGVYALTLDGEGHLGYEPWQVSRHNGRPYVRVMFRGNPVGMSTAARYGTRPVIEFGAALGAFSGLDEWHGVSRFFDSAAEAETALLEALGLSP